MGTVQFLWKLPASCYAISVMCLKAIVCVIKDHLVKPSYWTIYYQCALITSFPGLVNSNPLHAMQICAHVCVKPLPVVGFLNSVACKRFLVWSQNSLKLNFNLKFQIQATRCLVQTSCSVWLRAQHW